MTDKKSIEPPKTDCESIIEHITRKRLPLSAEQLLKVRRFCREQINKGNLKVLGEIPDILRKDWLNNSLDKETRACGHASLHPYEWRTAMEDQCERTVKAYIRQQKQKYNNKKILSLLIWKGALAYSFSIADYINLGLSEQNNIKMCHIEAKRNEKTLEITTPMPLYKKDKNRFRRYERYSGVIIPDPMLASGSSNAFAIEMLNGFGVPNEKITLLCVVAAPEGILRLLNLYPGVKIIAATLDDHLNEDAYIIPGLGDAGEKYFYENSITNFGQIEDLFYVKQWKHLKYLLEIVNRFHRPPVPWDI